MLICSASSPTPSSSSSAAKVSGPETTSMGSIADRMKALSGKGMDVGTPAPDRRIGKDTGVSHPPVSAGLSRMGAIHEAGPGSARAQRSRSNSQAGSEGQKQSPTGSGSRSRSSSIKENKPIHITPLPPHEEHTTSHASSSRAPPVIAPKPKLPVPPTHSQPLNQSDTGASTSSTRVNIGETQTPNTPRTEPKPIAPVHSGPAPPSAKSSKPPLPPIPQAQHIGNNPKPAPGPGPETNGLSDFEKTFPSLDEFGKQFADVPTSTPKTNGIEHKEDEDKYNFPDVPSGSFPNLPSVPSSRPGMATPPHGSPPTGFAALRPPHANGNGNGHDSPPLPDTDRETKRPSSQPNLTKLDGRVDPSIADGVTPPNHPAPTLQDFRTPQQPAPNPMSPQSTTSPNGHGNSPLPHSQPIAFPTPQPTPASASRRSMPVPPTQPAPVTKPKFPFSNSVNCETLRSHFLNPDVEMILLDVRPEEEYRRGVVGAEYEPRGAKLRVIWMDPTVLMRSE